MDKNDLPSDSDESDVDYAPSDDDNALSEVESDGDVEEDPAISGDEGEGPARKRRRKQKSGKKKPRMEEEELKSEEQKLLTEEEEKKKTDSLWSDFLSDTSTSRATSSKVDSATMVQSSVTREPVKIKATEQKVTITKVFEFAGEEVLVTKEVAVDSAEARINAAKPHAAAPVGLSRPVGPAGRGLGPARGGLKGLSAVLGQLGKKEKIGTLEKSKLDWDRFKKAEGIEDEVQTHNRGKDGYLERQDFLQRSDVRQFEIEKTIRTTHRSTR